MSCAPHVADDLAADIQRLARERCDLRRTAGRCGRRRRHRGGPPRRPGLPRRPRPRPGSPPSTPVTPTCSPPVAATDWLCLLEAFEQPHRSGNGPGCGDDHVLRRVRGESRRRGRRRSPTGVADTLREWADDARARGIAAVHEAATVAGMAGAGARATAAANATLPTSPTSRRSFTSWPTATGWVSRRCSTGCVPSARAGAAPRSATGGSTVTRPQSRS